MLESKKVIGMDASVILYYMVEALIANAIAEDRNNQSSMLHSHERLVDELISLKNILAINLASFLYDYLVYASFRELGHCDQFCSKCFPSKHFTNSPRNFIMANPQNILETSEKIFREYIWDKEYGGEAWAKITRYAMQYKKVTDDLFIDSIVDLEHNTGTVLNKEGPISTNIFPGFDLKEFLTDKTYYPIEGLYTYTAFLPYEVRGLVERYVNIYQGGKYKITKVITSFYDYCELRTGRIRLSLDEIIENTEESFRNLLCWEPIEYRDKFAVRLEDLEENIYFEGSSRSRRV